MEHVSGNGAAAGLLAADDPPPVRFINEAASAPALLICDHASAAVPRALGSLGLSGRALASHIAWDIGAAAVTEVLADQLDLPAILSGYSRLVVDCNRYLHDDAAMREVSDGVDIPGNRGIDDAAQEARAAACYWPYHHAVAARLDAMQRDGTAPMLVSIHSCTPRMNGVDRPWPIGVSWARDRRLSLPLIAALSAEGLTVGDNEPYAIDIGIDYTVPEHAMRRGLPHLQIEFRQDLIADAAGAERWAGVLADALVPMIGDPALHRVARYWP